MSAQKKTSLKSARAKGQAGASRPGNSPALGEMIFSSCFPGGSGSRGHTTVGPWFFPTSPGFPTCKLVIIMFPSGNGETKRKMLKTPHELGLAWATQPEIPVSTALFLLLKQSRAWGAMGCSRVCCTSACPAGGAPATQHPKEGKPRLSASHLAGTCHFPCLKLACRWPCWLLFIISAC